MNKSYNQLVVDVDQIRVYEAGQDAAGQRAHLELLLAEQTGHDALDVALELDVEQEQVERAVVLEESERGESRVPIALDALGRHRHGCCCCCCCCLQLEHGLELSEKELGETGAHHPNGEHAAYERERRLDERILSGHFVDATHLFCCCCCTNTQFKRVLICKLMCRVITG